MNAALISTERVRAGPSVSAVDGRIVWDPVKSLWFSSHAVLGLLALFAMPSVQGLAVFLLLSAATLCAGHSVGMHRLLIHRSFVVPPWLERILVWLGVLVGMAGPLGMVRAHDMRDWHQRQDVCPPHPSHGAGFWRDFWWQVHCVFKLDSPPQFVFEREISEDRFYRWLERWWMLQQIPLAIVLWLIGGIGVVLWGISLRIAVSLFGHWAVGHYAHRTGHQGWVVDGLPVQGFNLPGIGLLTFGENWHGNHHAFPHSARLGVEPGQLDPGWWFIRVLTALGLARDVATPDSQQAREGLRRVDSR
ncbi:acyl-CoA desaturase [Oceanicola sp. S124]|uniref:acyl-CoA desaturase n=1 Tax=Oceanicola sp. S124 TaxID=1042378 RepID=UPI00025585B6|nr:acyl-CoA desaturase [Oceanicola sp. S124]